MKSKTVYRRNIPGTILGAIGAGIIIMFNDYNYLAYSFIVAGAVLHINALFFSSKK